MEPNPPTKIKRGRGRPRIHPNGTTVFSVRVPTEQAARIGGLIAAILIIDGRCHDPDGAILIEALERRLRDLRNRDLDRVDRLLQ